MAKHEKPAANVPFGTVKLSSAHSTTASRVAEFGKREFVKAQQAHEEGVIAKRAAGLNYSGK